MEEFIGKLWHRLIMRAADNDFPEAEVCLDEVRQAVAVVFRALGGEGGLQITNATPYQHGGRRNWLQRMAGTGDKVELAWCDGEMLRLPSRLACFPDWCLNYDLYLWLAALVTVPVDHHLHWIERSHRQTAALLAHWPGMKKRYQRLVHAHLELRPRPDALPLPEARMENLIREALLDPQCPLSVEPEPGVVPSPVPLWLHPHPPLPLSTGIAPEETETEADRQHVAKKSTSESQRKQAERTQMPKGENGLLAFRLESLFSWAEYVKVDRTTDEEEDDKAMQTAEDLDVIHVARDRKSIAGRLRLDLDLPADEYDDLRLGDGILLPEWDYKTQRMQPDHCCLQPMMARHQPAIDLPERICSKARKLRRQFEALQPQRQWLNRQSDGTEIDLDACHEFLTLKKQGRASADQPLYRDYRQRYRSLSCLLLADLSLSTDAWVNNDTQVIDIIRDSLYLFAEALDATGDRFAIHGFSSRYRSHVRFHRIKRFDEHYTPPVRGRIQQIKPGYYTRMGAAIRYASQLLEAEPTFQKILLILTDGKPNDLDKYEGRYGIEDTRMAILEAEKKGLRPFCVTIDEKARDYLPYLFGTHACILIKNAEELPAKLPLLYLQMTR